MEKHIGYFYWGFLGDKKFNLKEEPVSTPDGNAFYSWSIISEIQKRGNHVHILYDRDGPGYDLLGEDLFKSFAQYERLAAYTDCIAHNPDLNDNKVSYEEYYKKIFDFFKFEYVIVEWRWDIPGRNDQKTKELNPASYQPDREIMDLIIKMCNEREIPVVVFDLDYKLTPEDVNKYNIKRVIELGRFWETQSKIESSKVQIPFDFSCIDEKPILYEGFNSDVIYIGNRYERDWAIDKYLPEGAVVHGNWLEPGHGDPEHEWPHLKFRKRLSASEICDPYAHSVTTVLLAKKSYCENGFMTARIQEAVFYGTVPLFMEEYGEGTIAEYAGKYAKYLTVKNKDEVKAKAEELKKDVVLRANIIHYLRHHLRFMDSKFFIDDVEKLVEFSNEAIEGLL